MRIGRLKPTESQPLVESLKNEPTAIRSIGQFQSWRSVGIPPAVTNAASAMPAAIENQRRATTAA